MTAVMKEVPHDGYKDLVEIFGKEPISKFREAFNGDSLSLVKTLKILLNRNGVIAEILTFTNGGAFSDNRLTVYDKKCNTYSVVLMGEWIIDLLNTDKIVMTKDYIEELEKNNKELKISYPLSTGWYTDDGFSKAITIKYLKEYRY